MQTSPFSFSLVLANFCTTPTAKGSFSSPCPTKPYAFWEGRFHMSLAIAVLAAASPGLLLLGEGSTTQLLQCLPWWTRKMQKTSSQDVFLRTLQTHQLHFHSGILHFKLIFLLIDFWVLWIFFFYLEVQRTLYFVKYKAVLFFFVIFIKYNPSFSAKTSACAYLHQKTSSQFWKHWRDLYTLCVAKDITFILPPSHGWVLLLLK